MSKILHENFIFSFSQSFLSYIARIFFFEKIHNFQNIYIHNINDCKYFTISLIFFLQFFLTFAVSFCHVFSFYLYIFF
uniref:Uncharacterized protein n=1 Tax=Nyssomyia neivai TaxID=330878 RepID=A0A1L8D775_9DIPT